MTALIRYHLALLALSQRYVAPGLAFVAMVFTLTASDSGRLTATYGLVAVAMLLFAAWITVALVAVDDRAHRDVMVATVGYRRLLIGQAGTALLCCLPVSLLGLVIPLGVGSHTVHTLDLVIGAAAQATAAISGIGIGLCCSPLLIDRRGVAVLVGLGLFVLALRLPVSPDAWLLDGLQGTPSSVGLLDRTLVLAAAALVTTVVVGATLSSVAPRRA